MNEEHQRALALAAMELYIKRERARRRRLILLSLGLYAIVLAFADVRRRAQVWHRRMEEWEDWNAHSIVLGAEPLSLWYRLVLMAVLVVAAGLAFAQVFLHIAIPLDLALLVCGSGIVLALIGLNRSFRP